jgi:ABC-type nickel/cobalt efflux system permease component RcnA
VTLLGATARQIDRSVAWIEIIAFAAIILLGLSLTYRKFKAFSALPWAGPTASPQPPHP